MRGTLSDGQVQGLVRLHLSRLARFFIHHLKTVGQPFAVSFGHNAEKMRFSVANRFAFFGELPS